MEFEYYLTQEEEKEEFWRKNRNKANHSDKSPSYLKEAACPGEGNLSGQRLF